MPSCMQEFLAQPEGRHDARRGAADAALCGALSYVAAWNMRSRAVATCTQLSQSWAAVVQVRSNVASLALLPTSTRIRRPQTAVQISQPAHCHARHGAAKPQIALHIAAPPTVDPFPSPYSTVCRARTQLICKKQLRFSAEAIGGPAGVTGHALAPLLRNFLHLCLDHALALAHRAAATPPVGLVLTSPLAILMQLLQCAPSCLLETNC
jgi:hypothetical protein